MATSPDHPELQFVQASGYTKGRADGPPLWIVIHDMEANETANTAEATANYFATGAGGRSVSSHYTADNNSVVQCVLLADVAWTVGNRPGNYRGINWELAGFATQTRAQWLDAFGVAMFNRIAPIIRSDAARFHIPLQRRSIAELKAFKPGVTSHNDLGIAFGGTDHTDPGPNFPWDHLMALLNNTLPEAEMRLATEPATGKRWIGDGVWRRQLTPAQAAGWVYVGTPDDGNTTDITIYGVDIATLGGSAPLTPEQLAQVTAAAESGAEAGAPTHDELVAAAEEGANKAEDS